MAESKTIWRVGDPEPEAKGINLKGSTGLVWYRYMDGWRHGLMAPHAAIKWATLLGHHAPLREIRLVGTKWMFADEIPQPTLGVIGAKAARTAGWVPLAEVLDVLWDQAQQLRQGFRTGGYGIEYINGWEAAHDLIDSRFATAPQGADEGNDRG